MRIIINACRLLVGIVFILSGLVKGIDPIGSVYKFTDYFNAFGMSWMNFSAVFFAFALPILEFLVGTALVFNTRTRLAAWGALIFMCAFTPLTLVLALTNPVSDCGCFGDAITLTNWQTFWKNIVLLVCSLFTFLYRRHYSSPLNTLTQWVFILLSTVFIAAVSIQGYTRLPLVDFRPYAIGNNLPEQMSVPEGEEPDQYAVTLRYRNRQTGEIQSFSENNYPWQDTLTWEYVDSQEFLVKKGFQPPIHDLYIEHPEYGDISEEILQDEGYTFLAVAYNLDLSDTDNQTDVNNLAEWAIKHGHRFWGLTASTPEAIAAYRDRHHVPYNYCLADETQLKTMIRSNPGIILLHRGTVIGKWPGNQLPNLNNSQTNDLMTYCLQEEQEIQREYLVYSFILLFFVMYFALPRAKKKR